MARTRIVRWLTVTAVVTLVAALTTVGWVAWRDRDAVASGSCDSGIYALSVGPDDGALELSFELTSAAPGESWEVVATHDGAVLYDGARLTDEDAEIDLDLPVRQTGSELTVTATRDDGTACRAVVSRG